MSVRKRANNFTHTQTWDSKAKWQIQKRNSNLLCKQQMIWITKARRKLSNCSYSYHTYMYIPTYLYAKLFADNMSSDKVERYSYVCIFIVHNILLHVIIRFRRNIQHIICRYVCIFIVHNILGIYYKVYRGICTGNRYIMYRK